MWNTRLELYRIGQRLGDEKKLPCIPAFSAAEPARRQEEKMVRKLIVTLIGVALVVVVLWLSGGCTPSL